MNPLESMENYLETIYVLSRRLGQVRSADIVNELNFSRPSVSVAMKKLRQSGHVTMDGDGYITLTETGLAVAQLIYERHTALSKFLVFLGVDKETADEDACRIEHVISQKSFDKICEHANKNTHIS